MTRLLLFLAATVPLLQSAVLAQENRYVVSGTGNVVIWRSAASAKDGPTPATAGPSEPALSGAVCVVDIGTTLVILPMGGDAARRVTVIDGPKRGCAGHLSPANISRTPGGPTLADEHRAFASRRQAETDAIRSCGRDTVAAVQNGEVRVNELTALNDGCLAKQGFPQRQFGADGREIK